MWHAKAFRGTDFPLLQIAVSSTITVTFPAPTAPGVPVVCARCTLFSYPYNDHVTLIHQGLRLVLGPRCGDHLHQCRILANFGEFCMNVVQQRPQQATPLGDGATTIELPHFRAFMMLFAGVAAGLVEGTIAPQPPWDVQFL